MTTCVRITPRKSHWGLQLDKMEGIDWIRLSRKKKNYIAQHIPPLSHPGCTLLPCGEDAASMIAENAKLFRKMGWTLLVCSPRVINDIRNKISLQKKSTTSETTIIFPSNV